MISDNFLERLIGWTRGSAKLAHTPTGAIPPTSPRRQLYRSCTKNKDFANRDLCESFRAFF